jgi:hypothetical protein
MFSCVFLTGHDTDVTENQHMKVAGLLSWLWERIRIDFLCGTHALAMVETLTYYSPIRHMRH